MTYEQSGNSQDYFLEKYILTYPISFYPAISDYKSYAYGILVGLVIFLASLLLVYRYRVLEKVNSKGISND